jgi:hypothetical protein
MPFSVCIYFECRLFTWSYHCIYLSSNSVNFCIFVLHIFSVLMALIELIAVTYKQYHHSHVCYSVAVLLHSAFQL